jgi:hypothetical protein
VTGLRPVRALFACYRYIVRPISTSALNPPKAPAVKPISNNAEFFAVLKGLIYSRCDRRALNPLARILGPYLAFDGLTDSWGNILTALKTIRASHGRDISQSETETLGELIRTAEHAIYRDKTSNARDVT